MSARVEPGDIERRFVRAAKLREEVERKERAIAQQVQGLAQALAELMRPGEHHHRRGVGIHAFDVGGSTRLTAAYLEERGDEFKYRFAVLCGGEIARRALRTAALDQTDADEPGPERHVVMATSGDCEDFLYRLPFYLNDVSRGWEERSGQLDEAKSQVKGARQAICSVKRRAWLRPSQERKGAGMSWTNEELFQALGRYEQECISAGMLPNAVHSYWDYARRFLEWRTGEYRPRGATTPARVATIRPVTVRDLANDAKAYASDVEAAGRNQATIDTYYRHAMFFVRWLDGEFTPGRRLSGR